MKRSQKIRATIIALFVVTFAATAGTTGTNPVHTLTENEWNTIAEEAEIENSVLLEAIPAFRTVNIKSLEMDFEPGTRTNLKLDAPFADKEVVGVVVLDDDGNIVHSTSGTYGKLKSVSFRDYYSQDMTYVVRIYSEASIFETKLQVVYR